MARWVDVSILPCCMHIFDAMTRSRRLLVLNLIGYQGCMLRPCYGYTSTVAVFKTAPPSWELTLLPLLAVVPVLQRTGHIVAEALADRGVYLKSLFLTVAPARKDFVATVGPRAAENVLSAVQWHPSMGYADSFFGTSAEYASEFEALFGTEPSYLAAMASATVFSLAVAIKGAFE
eukprot:1160838-Pelagomonas_calceolata.AAC.1